MFREEKNMLTLVNITKDYPVADGVVHALRGVSLNLRQSEFVAILGASGCGKTTLLNIIGGLDQYTSGDLIINGVSTKEYKDRDWDTYRNHSVGFVFQSYNLIPHQTVLANVEIALTLSGVNRAERRERAIRALERVGLGDQIEKLPRQLSGGQMQRVAIARALVNDPDILLADEPTGALDSVTSLQIMEILKEISKEKLVVMVTHNPELAEEYATRIIRAKDGQIIDDSDPYDGVAEASDKLTAEMAEKEAEEGAEIANAETAARKRATKKRTSMSFWTALSLSFRNLMTKKVRTMMISLAGSIGIIGIALILAVSTGVQALIDGLERSTMSSYPLSLQATTMDLGSMLGAMMDEGDGVDNKDPDTVYSHNVVAQMLEGIAAGIATNDLETLKKYLESDETNIRDLVHDIQYRYATGLNAYLEKKVGNTTSYVKNMYDYNELLAKLGVMEEGSGATSDMTSLMGGSTSTSTVWSELVGDEAYLDAQYDVVYGKLPTAADEIVLFVNENMEISDFLLYMLGVLDVEQLRQYNDAAEAHRRDPENNPAPEDLPVTKYTYEELCGLTFRYLTNADYYTVDKNTGLVREKTEEELNQTLAAAPALKIVGILTLSPDAVGSSTAGGVGYTELLMPSLIRAVEDSEVVKKQIADATTDVFTGSTFKLYTLEDYPFIRTFIESNPMFSGMLPAMGIDINDQEAVVALANRYMRSEDTYEGNLKKFGVVDEDSPSAILIYPKDFEAKEEINTILAGFSKKHSQLTYTDTVAIMMKSVTTIVDAISYVLVAFVSISLIVSSIMIGVITYISVLERIKEIGILRAMGASKRDISRVFNAETLVIGFSAGALGILISLGLIVIINIILYSLTELASLNAVLSLPAALVLIGISMLLTFVAGLIPSGIAARRDPVVALRSE